MRQGIVCATYRLNLFGGAGNMFFSCALLIVIADDTFDIMTDKDKFSIIESGKECSVHIVAYSVRREEHSVHE